MGMLEKLKLLPEKNELKGSFGEQLTRLFSKTTTDALILHDVLIDGAENATSQIDLLLVDSQGIYVVEVKNYPDAMICGDGKKNQWYYYRGGKRFEIYSPLQQNRQHIRYLKRMLAEKTEVPFFCVVVMLCKDFKVQNTNENPSCPDTFICNSMPALQRGRKYLEQYHPKVLNEQEKQEIWQYIKEHQYSGKSARVEHKVQLVAQQNQREESKRKSCCPYCNAPLVIRQGKYGSFYGCSNYPKCRYTQKISEEQ